MGSSSAAARLPELGAFRRARPGTVAVVVPAIGVQTRDAARILGVSEEVLHQIPFETLPFRRVGRHRWYLVRLVEELAESLMAEQIARGRPATMERFGDRVIPRPTARALAADDGRRS